MHLTFALPSTAGTGSSVGVDYVHGLMPGLRALGHEANVVEGDEPVFPDGSVPVVDGFLLPHLQPRLAELVGRGAVAVVHHASARAGRDEGARDVVGAIEREMLPKLRRVVATSQAVADRLQAEFGVERVAVVPPGLAPLPRSVPPPGPVQVLSAGVLTPRKGFDTLLRAMTPLQDVPWRLTIAGSSTRDPTHARQLAAMVTELGLDNRARVAADPDTDTMNVLWQSAGVFALATRWEGYPAAVATALRRGVPVFVTHAGSGNLVPQEAGVVCPADDLPTFSKSLRRLLFSDALRADMAEGAWRTGQDLPGWDTQARVFHQALQE